jgi:hypothetical protein
MSDPGYPAVKTCERQDVHGPHDWQEYVPGGVYTDRPVLHCRGSRPTNRDPLYQVTIAIEPEPGIDAAPGAGRKYSITEYLAPGLIEPQALYQLDVHLEVALRDLGSKLAGSYFELALREKAQREGRTYLNYSERLRLLEARQVEALEGREEVLRHWRLLPYAQRVRIWGLPPGSVSSSEVGLNSPPLSWNPGQTDAK